MLKHKLLPIKGINADDTPELIEEGQLLNLMNARVAVSEFGRNLRVENVPGTSLVSQSVYPPYGTQICIGSCVDIARRRILFALYNTFDDHGIYCFDTATNTVYAVLYDSQVIGGLDFSRSNRIDRNMRVVGDLLYWTDNSNQPRRINIEAGIKMNHASYVTDVVRYEYPMNPEVITVIRKPPNYPITFVKTTSGAVGITLNVNQIKNNSFRYTYFYEYRDGEQSTLAPHSILAPYNYASESYDVIQLKVPLTELVDQDVQKVTLVVIYPLDEKYFEIKTWDKGNATDLAEIVAHNAGTTALTFNFTNTSVGAAIDGARSIKPFDSVPRLSKSLELAKNRLFFGNNLMGYDTPLRSSLTAAVVQQNTGSSTVSGSWIQVSFKTYGFSGDPMDFAVIPLYFAYFPTAVDATHPAGYYGLTTSYYDLSAPNPLPSSPININDYTFIDVITPSYDPTYPGGFGTYNSYSDFVNGEFGFVPTSVELYSETTAGALTANGSGAITTNRSVLKSDSSRRLAIVFYDKYMRQCGVVPYNSLITTPDRAYTFSTTYNYAIQWALSNAAASAEIPDWAYYYSIVATKDLVRSYFIQARTSSVKYATKDSTGAYEFTTDAYADTNAGVAIKLDLLDGYGMGYSFADGDIVKLWVITGTTFDDVSLRVIAQDGQWIVAELYNFGNLSAFSSALFEIYTPRPQSAGETYFEQGVIYPITNPTAANREYSTTSGYLTGDVYLLSRGTSPSQYVTENMSPSTTIWQNWFTDAGRVQIVDKIGEQQLSRAVRWSNTYLSERSNGLSSFDASDQRELAAELASITKLQLSAKISEEGSVMLAICPTNTVSLYLSEVQVVGASSNAFLAQSTQVIGGENVLKGGYGSISSESVVEYLGNVYWLDLLNGCFVQYASNGLEPVSRYKCSRFFERYSRAYQQANSNNLTNINGFSHIPTGVDPSHKEVLCTVPGLIYANYADTLPSYSSVPSYASDIINRFDLYDQLGKTLAFCFEENKWGNNYQLMAEQYEYVNNESYAFKNGALYKMNADTANYNNFFGVDYPVRIMMPLNVPMGMKELSGLAVEANAKPDWAVAYTSYPNVQITDLTEDDFTTKEGVHFSPFYRDRLSPNTSGSVEQKMYGGDKIRSKVPFVMLEFAQNDSLFYLNFVESIFSPSKGMQVTQENPQ